MDFKQLLQEQKEQREKFKLEESLKTYISKKTKIPFSIYLNNLWGRTGDIKFKDLFREDNLNKEELKELLKIFKPLKMYKVEDACLSFRNTKDEKATNTEINPYILKYTGLKDYNDKIVISWFTKIKGLVYEIEAYISNMDFIKEIALRNYDIESFKGGFRVYNVHLSLNGNFQNGYKVITWGRGSDTNPNDFTIYSEDLKKDFIKDLN